MNTKKLLLRGALAILIGLPPLFAQTKQVTVNATIAEMLNLTVDATSVALAFVGTDYDVTSGLAVKEAVAATTFRVLANRAWRLSARAGNPAFTFTAVGTAADPLKPSSALSIRTGTTAYAPFAGVTELTVATGTRGGYGKPGNVLPVDYQMRSDLATDPPGAYLLTLTYTLAAQ